MISSTTVHAFADELRKIAMNDAFLARRAKEVALNSARALASKSVAKPTARIGKPPPVPPAALKAKSQQLTPGGQQAAARGASDMDAIENTLLAPSRRAA